jgi:Ca2+-binding EF-hand superfamily protein
VTYFVSALREVFDMFDKNGGGTINTNELDLALRSVDMFLKDTEIEEVLAMIDNHGMYVLTNKNYSINQFEHVLFGFQR